MEGKSRAHAPSARGSGGKQPMEVDWPPDNAPAKVDEVAPAAKESSKRKSPEADGEYLPPPRAKRQAAPAEKPARRPSPQRSASVPAPRSAPAQLASLEICATKSSLDGAALCP